MPPNTAIPPTTAAATMLVGSATLLSSSCSSLALAPEVLMPLTAYVLGAVNESTVVAARPCTRGRGDRHTQSS